MNETCDGIGCGNTAPAPQRDGTPEHGWIEVRVDDETHRFCSWNCLSTYVAGRLQGSSGD
jgi:hypothetical protein